MNLKKISVLIVGVTLSVSGCLGGFSPNSTFYMLSTPQKVEALSQRKLDIQVEGIELADYLQQPQIVTIDDNRVEIVRSEFNRWGAPLNDIIQRTLAADISMYLPLSQVKTTGNIFKPSAYNIQVTISRFEGTWNEKAVLEAWWSIIDKQGKNLYSNRSYLTADIGTSYVDLVEKQSELVDELAKTIAKAILKQK